MVIKVTNPGVPPLLQAGIRSAGATVMIGVWVLARRQPLFARDGTLWWGGRGR